MKRIKRKNFIYHVCIPPDNDLDLVQGLNLELALAGLDGNNKFFYNLLKQNTNPILKIKWNLLSDANSSWSSQLKS